MKKVLKILSTITLSTITTTNIIACHQSNTNNENNKPTKTQFTPQQPLQKSNWKLVNDIMGEANSGKTYIGIFGNKPYVNITSWKGIEGEGLWHLYEYKTIYRWDGIGKPTIPTINKKTGEIINWNEKIES